MKAVRQVVRGLFVAGVAVAAFISESPAIGHVVPRQPEARAKRPSPRPAVVRQPVEDWTGPTRQATVWR